MRTSVLLLVTMTAAGQQTPRYRLADLEKMALERNPAIAQAAAGVRAAEGRVRQAGLYPNPFVGFNGDEVTPGPNFRGGEYGGIFEQRIVTGGKLGIAKGIAGQNRSIAMADADLERQRVLNQVRTLFYEGLGQQKLLEVRANLTGLAKRAVETTRELANVGQADLPDLAAVEIEAQRLELGLVTGGNALDRTRRQLSAAVGATLAPGIFEGNIDEVPAIDFDRALARVLEESPEMRAVQSGLERSRLSVRQYRAEVIPDLITIGGVHYNRTLLELNRQPVGWMGSFTVGVSVPLFNRNQGAIAAARADEERARLEIDRRRLHLRTRMAAVYQEYRDASAAIERYRTEMIPKAQKAYEMYLTNFRRMSAAYPQVLIAQRNLFQLQEDYVAALIAAWQRSVEIEGLLVAYNN